MTKNELQDIIDESVQEVINEQVYENSINELYEATEYLEQCLYEEYTLFENPDILCESETVQKLAKTLADLNYEINKNKNQKKIMEKELKFYKDRLGKPAEKLSPSERSLLSALDKKFGNMSQKDISSLSKEDKSDYNKYLKLDDQFEKSTDYSYGKKKIDQISTAIDNYDRKLGQAELQKKRTLGNIKIAKSTRKFSKKLSIDLGRETTGDRLNKINEPTTSEKFNSVMSDKNAHLVFDDEGVKGQKSNGEVVNISSNDSKVLDKAETKVQDLKSTEAKKELSQSVAKQLPDNPTKAQATDKALDVVNNKLDSKKFEKKGNKIVTVFKNSDGSLNKKAVTIAALATAAALSIGAAAIVHKKKKKAEEAKKKMEEDKNKKK